MSFFMGNDICADLGGVSGSDGSGTGGCGCAHGRRRRRHMAAEPLVAPEAVAAEHAMNVAEATAESRRRLRKRCGCGVVSPISPVSPVSNIPIGTVTIDCTPVTFKSNQCPCPRFF